MEKLKENQAGKIDFNRLEPGDYYLMMEKKEYRFEPNNIELHFSGRKSIRITAIRYQNSALGQLSSLSQASLENSVVQGTF